MKKDYSLAYLACYLVLIKDNQVLMHKRKKGWGEGMYSLIAGHVDEAEGVLACMIREAKEEGDITLEEKDLEVIHTMHIQTDKNYIAFFITTSRWKGDPQILEPEKASDLGWFNMHDLPENTLPLVKVAIDSYKKKIPFSEIGF